VKASKALLGNGDYKVVIYLLDTSTTAKTNMINKQIEGDKGGRIFSSGAYVTCHGLSPA